MRIFGGSGSTLIACEQLGRKCRMVEIDLEYCSVIVQRYVKYCTDEGLTPTVSINGIKIAV